MSLQHLGCPAALVGVLGDDAAGDLVLAQAVADGLWISGITRRDVATALQVDVVEASGTRRLLEDVPDPTLLRPDDVSAAAALLERARAVVLQLRQPGPALRTALAATGPRALRVAEGVPADEETRTGVLRQVHLLRADALEAGVWVGSELDGLDDVRAAVRELCSAGPRVVSLAAGEDGDLTVWREPSGRLGEVLVPPLGEGDPGAGAAAALAEVRPGNRPRLDPEEVGRLADRARRDADAR